MDHSSGEPNRQSPNPRNLFTMNGIYDFRIYNSVPLDPSSIKYRTVPFHRIINQVFPPMCIRFAPIIEVAGPEYCKHLL